MNRRYRNPAILAILLLEFILDSPFLGKVMIRHFQISLRQCILQSSKP